jgi:predicted  nucleic acid-binding Zn-ribbon protein
MLRLKACTLHDDCMVVYDGRFACPVCNYITNLENDIADLKQTIYEKDAETLELNNSLEEATDSRYDWESKCLNQKDRIIELEQELGDLRNRVRGPIGL